YDKIDKRIDNWFEQGMVEEIGKLLDSGIDADWLIGLGLQYKIIGSYLRQMKKDTSESDTSYRIPDTQLQLLGQRLKFKTHAYARRQLTWFRRFPEIIWAEKLTSAEKAIGDFLQ
ncbi:hypothetical protein COT12_03105, partial [Candidatus Berkelbacteria bacterium CG08_land_8_20_14_0_20_39_8]